MILLQSGHAGKTNSGLLPLYPHANTQGVFDMISPTSAPAKTDVTWMIGVGDGKGLPQASFVVVQELFLTDLARQADVILPALSFAEREGTFTNGDRRVQHLYRALPGLGEGQPDWWIVQEVANRLGAAWNYANAGQIFAEIVQRIPAYAALSYEAISHVESQWPPVGRSDLYYGGTVYDNSGGMGARYAADAEQPGFTAHIVMIAPPEATIECLRRVGRRLYQDGELIRRSAVLAAHIVDGQTEIARAAR
jgi:NADH-quinone oxidoreductase subunit G